MNAQEAFRLGLVDKIVPANDPLFEEAKRIAKTIIDNAPLALDAGKRGHKPEHRNVSGRGIGM